MNVIGEVGNFIIEYQEPIQAGAIVCLAVLCVFILCRLMINARQKSKWLEEINENVSELKASVKALNEKKTEVIYVDGRVIPESRTTRDEKIENGNEVKDVQAAAQAESLENTEDAGMSECDSEKQSPTLKYVSRDCGISKDGHKYTIEELDAQIKD